VSPWIQAARPLAHANIAPPLILGQALACAGGATFDPAMAALAHGFGALDHLFIVFANDYADREGDALHDAPTPFSGGSRVIPEGKLAPRALRTAAIACAGLLLAVSAIGLAVSRPLLPCFAIAAIALLWAYSYPPLRLAYRGLGELAQGAGVGLVLPLLGYYAQRGDLREVPWPAFAPLIVLATASNIATAIPDRAADARAGKRTWAVRLGSSWSRPVVLLAIIAGAAMVPLVTPPLAPLAQALVVVPVILLAMLGQAVTENVRFVLLGGAAIAYLHVAWTIALVV
jgi:1,4-dihydroxy-2-naphthoate octaprenyltransferase